MKFKKILIGGIVCTTMTALSPTSSAADEVPEPPTEQQYSESEIVDGMEVSAEAGEEERSEFA